jgi:hypothetical protein
MSIPVMLTDKKTPMIQFGTSRSLQAALFVSEPLECGEAIGAITVVQTSDDVKRRVRLAALSNPSGIRCGLRGCGLGRRSLMRFAFSPSRAGAPDGP